MADPPRLGATATTTPPTISLTERSRWPGTEARIAYAAGEPGTGAEIGIGGYFSPMETNDNVRFDAWAGSVDLRLPVTRHFAMTANAYRGQALGGLGEEDTSTTCMTILALWRPHARWTMSADGRSSRAKVSERLQFNGGYGIDNPFTHEIRDSLDPDGSSSYSGLTRNRQVFGNVIYSPSAYLLFSLEYRRLWTNYITGPTNSSNVIGIGAGYKF